MGRPSKTTGAFASHAALGATQWLPNHTEHCDAGSTGTSDIQFPSWFVVGLDFRIYDIAQWYIYWLLVWNMFLLFFHSVGKNNPNWLFFSEGLKPPTSIFDLVVSVCVCMCVFVFVCVFCFCVCVFVFFCVCVCVFVCVSTSSNGCFEYVFALLSTRWAALLTSAKYWSNCRFQHPFSGAHLDSGIWPKFCGLRGAPHS